MLEYTSDMHENVLCFRFATAHWQESHSLQEIIGHFVKDTQEQLLAEDNSHESTVGQTTQNLQLFLCRFFFYSERYFCHFLEVISDRTSKAKKKLEVLRCSICYSAIACGWPFI